MTPQPRSVTEAGHASVARGLSPWKVEAADFFDQVEVLRERYAGLIGGDADGVALVPSAAYALSLAAANVDVPAGGRVVVLDEQFPSNVYPWRAAAARSAGEIVTVERPPDGDWTPGVLAAIDERTAVVAVPHCHWTDATLVDLVRVGARAREAGAALVVDASQSLGAWPLDVGEVRPDFLVAVGYKWLLGPYSLGYLWVAPERRGGQPLEYGWSARAGSDDFARLVDYRDDFRSGARRFDVGETANFLLAPMAIAALEVLLEWGLERVSATVRARSDDLAARAARQGLTVAAPAHRAHFLGLRLPQQAPADLSDRLAAAGVYVSVRGASVRVSPHVYTDRDDADRFESALAAAL